MNNIVQEICKNLALCGISSITIRLRTEKKSKTVLYSSIESELKDIHPKIDFKCSVSDDIPCCETFDFIIACGHHETVCYSHINKSARDAGICNLLCFEHLGKFFIFNDFAKFIVNGKDDQKIISYSSFDDVLKHNSLTNSEINTYHRLFYQALECKIIIWPLMD